MDIGDDSRVELPLRNDRTNVLGGWLIDEVPKPPVIQANS